MPSAAPAAPSAAFRGDAFRGHASLPNRSGSYPSASASPYVASSRWPTGGGASVYAPPSYGGPATYGSASRESYDAVEDNPFIAGAFHGPGEPQLVLNVGISGPGVVHSALKRLIQALPEDLCCQLLTRRKGRAADSSCATSQG